MARIGLVGGSYTSQSVNADAQLTMNLYPEAIESGQGKSAMALYHTPGLIPFVNFGPIIAVSGGVQNGPVCGLTVTSQIVSGLPVTRTFAVVGGSPVAGGSCSLIEFTSTGALTVWVPSIFHDGTAVNIAVGQNSFLFATKGVVNTFNYITNTFTQISTGILSNAIDVGYVDGFYLALTSSASGPNVLHASAPLDATTWPGTSIDSQNIFADLIQSIIVDHRETWLFGLQRSIVYFDAGSSPFPLQVIPSGIIEQGIVAAKSKVRLDNSVFWLGGDERGNGVAWRAQGYTPSRVSNHAVEFAWSQYATITDAIGYSYQDQGHSFWVLYFPTANATWVYDVSTGMWHQRGYLNSDGVTFSAHRSWNHIFAYGKHLVGDPLSSIVYQMSIGVYSDNGNPIQVIRRSPHVSTENEWIFHHQLQLDMETGLGGTFPQIPQGTTTIPSIILQDASTADWLVTVDDKAILHSASTIGTPSATIVLNDTVIPATSWQLGINTTGLLTLTSVAFNASNPSTIWMSSTPSNLVVGISVSNGLITDFRRPQVSLRWSDDGGHTWSNYHPADIGNTGQYKTRAMWRRLGRSRDRVYEISASDPIPWRFLEEDLLATPGFAPSERISKQYVKVT